MADCRMTFHIVGREKKEVPCCDHGADCREKPIACNADATCGICGMCKRHCVGHMPLRKHLAIANRVEQ